MTVWGLGSEPRGFVGVRGDGTRSGRQGCPQSVTFIDRDISFQATRQHLQPPLACGAPSQHPTRYLSFADTGGGSGVSRPGGVGVLGAGCPCHAGSVSGCSELALAAARLRYQKELRGLASFYSSSCCFSPLQKPKGKLQRCHIHFSPSRISLLDLNISPLALHSSCPTSAISAFPLCPEPLALGLSPGPPSPVTLDLPSRGRGTAGSCLHREGLFRQLELWAAAAGLGQGALQVSAVVLGNADLSRMLRPRQCAGWSGTVQSACWLPASHPGVIDGAH